MPHGKLPPAETAGHSLMDTLSDLLVRLSHTGKSNTSMSVVEAYNTYVKSSEHGRYCQYADKCEYLFRTQDYEDIKTLILHVVQCIRKIEGPDWGK